MKSNCQFCNIDPSRIIATNRHAMAIFDGYPISPGHTLIISKRHFASFFEVKKDEREGIFDLLELVKLDLVAKLNPAGFNIGINDGLAAGQTINHLHVHLIPRYIGDTNDPRGGIRWIFPNKASYWTSNY